MSRYLSKPLLAVLLAGVLIHAIVFVAVMISPITNENGDPVSPLTYQTGMDFPFYAGSLERMKQGAARVVDNYSHEYGRSVEDWGLVLAGPGLPLLLWIFEYRPDNTLPLALFYWILGVAFMAIWVVWLYGRGVPLFWLFLFAVAPNEIWYSLNISTDMPFALCFTAFYFTYARVEGLSDKKNVLLLFFLMLCLILRPNALSILLFIVVHAVIINRQARLSKKLIYGFIMVLVTIPGLFYYGPAFFTFVRDGNELEFFAITQKEYISGLFPQLYWVFDKALSWFLLLGAKTMYFAGLRPSYSGIDLHVLFARSGLGLILLPGLVYGLLRGSTLDRVLIVTFIFPVIAGASQDRYNLPIQGLLYFYGYCAIRFGFERLKRIAAVKPLASGD
jgi:hypothetical protein